MGLKGEIKMKLKREITNREALHIYKNIWQLEMIEFEDDDEKVEFYEYLKNTIIGDMAYGEFVENIVCEGIDSYDLSVIPFYETYKYLVKKEINNE